MGSKVVTQDSNGDSIIGIREVEMYRTYRRSHYQNRDPYWLNARFESACSCGKSINKGDKILYYPNGRKAVCEDCGRIGWSQLQDEISNETTHVM